MSDLDAGDLDALDEWMSDNVYLPDVAIEAWLIRYGDEAAEVAAHGHPQMFAKMYEDGLTYGIDREDLAEHVGTAWFWWGDTHLCREGWRDLFDIAGYREDDCPAERPTEPLVLWRGATPEHRANWSWTDVRDAAVNFASGWCVQDDLGLVWRAVVEPDRLLAKMTSTLRGFSEYVVDTDGLAVEPDGLWCRCPVDLDAFRGSDRESQIALDLHELIECPRR